MSLRDFVTPSSDDPIALHNAPLGSGSGLESFHTIQPEDLEPSTTPKIVGALAVALMLGVAGTALYMSSGSSSAPKPVTAASNPPASQSSASSAPAPAAVTPDAGTPASTPAASTETAPAPVTTPAPVTAVKTVGASKTHVAASASNDRAGSNAGGASSARMAADSSAESGHANVQPQQQVAVPNPMSPAPSPSDVATNNSQSGVAVPQDATTASDVPATATAQNNTVAQPQPPQSSIPQVGNTAPVQDQQTGAAPAQPPAQSAGQASQ